MKRRFVGGITRTKFPASSQSVLKPSWVSSLRVRRSPFAIEPTQVHAWQVEIRHLQSVLSPFRGRGKVYFEYDVPRMGKRIDVVLLVDNVLFVIEYKVGERSYPHHAILQVWDYALDLKNFHESSHHLSIVPILIATDAKPGSAVVKVDAIRDQLFLPVCANPDQLHEVIHAGLAVCDGTAINPVTWEAGRYAPTPTIVEAAMTLYAGHNVSSISRSDAGARNLSQTSIAIEEIIAGAQRSKRKVLCLVTGVPGAGKTLVGLNIATLHTDPSAELYSVYLSGNGPLVSILHEALARDRVARDREQGVRTNKGQARQAVKEFIQNVHHFRDDCLRDAGRAPVEHVAIFDEAQRAWNLEKTAAFMARKKGVADFNSSEPEFLISCLDRHQDWAVVVCLVGGGQEINTGEAGIGEWIRAIEQSFPKWEVHLSPHLNDSEYGAGAIVKSLAGRPWVTFNENLHLSVSMRSFRAEHVSSWVKAVLDVDLEGARRAWDSVQSKYPICVTRDVTSAKRWLRSQARGTERYGIIVSSQAQRLNPLRQCAVVAKHQDGLVGSRGGGQLLGAEDQDHGLAGAGHAVDDPVAFAQGAGDLFLLQVHDLQQVGELSACRALFVLEQSALMHPDLGKEMPAHAVALGQGKSLRGPTGVHAPKQFLKLFWSYAFG